MTSFPASVLPALVFVLAMGVGSSLLAQSRIIERDEEFRPQWLLLPYAFYNENFGWALGGAVGVTGYPQEHSASVLSPIVSTNGTLAFYYLARDFQMPWVDRLFLDPWISMGRFGEIQAYRNGDPEFAGQRAGSNSSDSDDYLEGDGTDAWFKLRFKYLLPMGHGRDTIINTYLLDRGLLVSGATGGDPWNPLKSGRTYAELEPFYRKQRIDSEYVDETVLTNGLKFTLTHDNRDFTLNPSKGSLQRIGITRDFGWQDSSGAWTVVEGEFSKFFSLGSSENFRQRVVAFNFWTADTLTWRERKTLDGGTEVSGRAPDFAGATLGGLYRLRGFPASRFSERSAIHYSLEYRMTPRWNPFDHAPDWLQKLGVAWIQFVPFLDVGRVADEYDLKTLHTGMKWNVGLGFRLMAKGLVARIDTAAGQEGLGVQMMVAQPF